jgi:hypothetical protein
MNTSITSDAMEARSVDPHSQWFAAEWLRGSPGAAARTVPVLAVVAQLLAELRDEEIPAEDAHRSMCRAVRLLSVFAAEPTPRQRSQEYDEGYERGSGSPAYTEEDVTAAAQSQRFAKETLRGTLRQAIRTEPVIAVVQELHSLLLAQLAPRAVHTAVRRAVRLLSVYVDDEHQHRQHDAA